MNSSALTDLLERFSTQRIEEFLTDLHLGEMLHNPWFIAGIVAAALLALYLKWRILFVTILSGTAVLWLLDFISERGTSIDSMSNSTLLIFIAIGCGIVGLIIYFLFIRSD